jgi:hypothetical protein
MLYMLSTLLLLSNLLSPPPPAVIEPAPANQKRLDQLPKRIKWKCRGKRNRIWRVSEIFQQNCWSNRINDKKSTDTKITRYIGTVQSDEKSMNVRKVRAI